MKYIHFRLDLIAALLLYLLVQKLEQFFSFSNFAIFSLLPKSLTDGAGSQGFLGIFEKLTFSLFVV